VASPARTRLTASERREHVLVAAVAEFSRTGYHGTPTEAIARRAGISQPYLFRLYGTKKDLFLACVDRCFDLTTETFREAAAADAEPDAGETPAERMGRAYVEMLADRELLLFQLQTYVAAEDAEVGALARRRYERLRAEIGELTGEDADDVLRFMGQGMLLNVAAALRLDPESWVWKHEDDA
jgi:AcrR family transcriptional regulator